MLQRPAEPSLGLTSTLLTDQERKLLLSLVPHWQEFGKSYAESAKAATDLRGLFSTRSKITKILKPPSFGIRFDELEETLNHWQESPPFAESEKPWDSLEAAVQKGLKLKQSRNQPADGEMFLLNAAQQFKESAPAAATCILKVLAEALSPTAPEITPFYRQDEKNSISINYIGYLSGGFPVLGFLAKPQGAGPFPMVIIGHDGFWGLTPFSLVAALLLAQQGFLAFAPEFRGQGHSHGTPEMADGEVEDFLSAITYLSEKEGGNPEKLFFIGEGHGGMVAFIAGARTKAQKVILLPFIPDLPAFWNALQKSRDRGHTWEIVSLLLFCGGSPDQYPTEYRKRSPIQYLDRLQSPLLFLLGDSDPMFPITKLLDVVRELKSFQTSYKLSLYAKGDHHLHLGASGQEVWETILQTLHAE